jgi:hypothetical protein
LILEKAMQRNKKSANGANVSVVVFGVDDHGKARAAVFQPNGENRHTTMKSGKMVRHDRMWLGESGGHR